MQQDHLNHLQSLMNKNTKCAIRRLCTLADDQVWHGTSPVGALHELPQRNGPEPFEGLHELGAHRMNEDWSFLKPGIGHCDPSSTTELGSRFIKHNMDAPTRLMLEVHGCQRRPGDPLVALPLSSNLANCSFISAWISALFVC